MVDIPKASRVQEKDFRLRDSDLKSELDRLQVVEALRHGNIYEVFAKSTKFKIGDFTDFFSNQWKAFKGQIVQDAEIKAGEGSYHAPDMTQFPVHHKGAALSADEGKVFTQEMMDFASGEGEGKPFGGKFKTQTLKGEGLPEGMEGEAAAGGPMSADELQQMAQGTMGEWEQFMDNTWGQIFDAQMMSDYKNRMNEIKGEVQRILALVKSGQIGAEFALIAMAKVNNTKNGCLMTWLGKKAFHVNESMTKVANELSTLGASDPRYFSALQDTQAKTRDGSFQLQLLMTDMQKVMQDVAGVLESVHSMIGEINRTKRELITQIAAR